VPIAVVPDGSAANCRRDYPSLQRVSQRGVLGHKSRVPNVWLLIDRLLHVIKCTFTYEWGLTYALKRLPKHLCRVFNGPIDLYSEGTAGSAVLYYNLRTYVDLQLRVNIQRFTLS
jgi:hypothetical protein